MGGMKSVNYKILLEKWPIRVKLKTQLDVWGKGNRLVLHTAEGKPGSPGTAGCHPSTLKAASLGRRPAHREGQGQERIPEK